MPVHLIDEQWSLEREWDSDWQSLYSGIIHRYDDQKKQIIREVCERYANVRSQSEGCPQVKESSVVSPKEVPPHVQRKLTKLGFLRPASTTRIESSGPAGNADLRATESKDQFVVRE